MKKGFTLIEMVVTIAIIAIVSAAIIVGIAPAQRIKDAQNSRARQDVRGVATAIETCLSWTDANNNTPPVTFCKDAASLIGTNSGGPYARSIPTAVTVTSSTTGSNICAYEQGAPGTYWLYQTKNGQVTSGASTTCNP